MNTYTIADFFSDYKEIIPAALENGKILKLVFGEDNKSLSCLTAFPELVSFDMISEFEMKMRAQLNIDRFEIKPKFTPDLLTADYFPEICKFLKSRFPPVFLK